MTAAGGLALLAVTIPIIAAFFNRIRWQRIWALAQVSLKEALRKRVVVFSRPWRWSFCSPTGLSQGKRKIRFAITSASSIGRSLPLFLLTAGLLGAFSIPNDVKNQSIHTIVTKPVEKFEIVLGRFLGYGILLTVGLAVIACLSLIYVLRGVNAGCRRRRVSRPRARYTGNLGFWRTKGDSVGREWDYRKYIAGPQPNQLNAPPPVCQLVLR